MSLSNLMASRNMSAYRLAKSSNIPYATISDLCNGKSRMDRCTAGTLYKLAKALDISMEELMEMEKEVNTDRPSFDWFRSEVAHTVKEKGDFAFIRDVLTTDMIRDYYNKAWYKESLYLLATLDYLSREHNLPTCRDFNDLRTKKLAEPVFPLSVVMAADLTHDESVIENCVRKAIPEFLRHNIMEVEIRDVV